MIESNLAGVSLDNEQANQLINAIVSDYFNTFNYEPINISLTFTDSLWEAYFSLRPDHRKQLQDQLPIFNGTVATPETLDGVFTVIVDGQYALDDMRDGKFSWIGTIIHEITHARDYKEYASLIGALNYDEVLNTGKHRMFHLWTEFNARRHGHYFVRKYTFEDINDKAQIPDIIGYEMPAQIKYMDEQYGSTADGWRQIYTVTQFLGRLAVWQDLFPGQFSSQYIKSLLGANRWMLEMYEYLNTHRDLSAAIDSFEDLHEIVLNNFPEA